MAMFTSTTPVLSGLSGVGIVLEGVSWETYERLLEGIGDDHVRVTYDNGTMEIEMSPSRKHEGDADFLRSLVTLVCSLTETPATLGGSTTHKRKDLAKGLEPDGCYWIAHESELRGVANLNLTKHPPPDLVIEVDLTSRSVDKIDIYASLGVQEIWHMTDKGQLVFLSLNADRNGYDSVEESCSFPSLSRSRVADALEASSTEGAIVALNSLVRELGLR